MEIIFNILFRKEANFNDKDFDSHSWKILENISRENHLQVVSEILKFPINEYLLIENTE